MKEKCRPPRYLVQLPDGECELDALELFKLFEAHKIDFQTQIRPVDGGDWRKFGEEPEFSTILPDLWQKARIRWWLPAFMLFMIALMQASLAFGFPKAIFAVWPVWFLYFIFYPIFFYQALMVTLLGFDPTDKRLDRMLITWWNLLEIYRLLRDCACELPKNFRCWLKMTAPLICITYTALYLTFCFAPANYTWGICVYSLFGALLFFQLICTIPITVELKRRSVAWFQANPNPPCNKQKPPSWYKFDWPQFSKTCIVDLPFRIGCLICGIILLLLPYYVIGEIRWKMLPHHKLQFFEGPYAGLELEKINLPEIPERFIPMWEAECKVPDDFKTEFKKVAPQLTAIRKILRAYPHLGLRRDGYAEKDLPIDKCNQTLRRYRRWRQAELHCGGSVLELLHDLTRMTQYAAEDPVYGIYYLNCNLRMTLVERYLTRFTNAELAREKAYWKDMLVKVNSTVRQHILQDNLALLNWGIAECKERIYLKILLLLFENGLRATIYEDSAELSDIVSRDVWQNQAEFNDYQAKMRQSAIHFFVDSISDNFNSFVSRCRAVCLLTPAGIELEEYRRKHGKYPVNSVLPIDPFSGKTMLYKPGKVIYSVGSNLQDDNGSINIDKECSDIVFRLPPE